MCNWLLSVGNVSGKAVQLGIEYRDVAEIFV